MSVRGILLVLASIVVLAPDANATSSPGTQLSERIEQFVRERAPVPPSTITVPPLEHFAVPGIEGGEIDVGFSTHAATRFLGRVPITVTLSQQGRVLRRAVVPVEVLVKVPVVVARRPVSRGELIGPEHLSLEFREVRSAPDDWVEDPIELEGFRAKRRVTQGTPFKRGWAEAAPTVRRGQAVRTVFAQGKLVIAGRGEVRQDGRTGDWVRVLNIDSKREIWGRVAQDGTILVGF